MPATCDTWTVEDMARRYGITVRQIYNLLAKRELPPRIKVPGRKPFWFCESILEYEASLGVFRTKDGTMERIPQAITIDELAERWNVEVATDADLLPEAEDDDLGDNV